MKKFNIAIDAKEAHGNVRWFNMSADRKLQKRANKVLNKCYRAIRRASKKGKVFVDVQMVNCPWEKREWLEEQLIKRRFNVKALSSSGDLMRISWKVEENW